MDGVVQEGVADIQQDGIRVCVWDAEYSTYL
jgi:hypothetical protein